MMEQFNSCILTPQWFIFAKEHLTNTMYFRYFQAVWKIQFMWKMTSSVSLNFHGLTVNGPALDSRSKNGQ